MLRDKEGISSMLTNEEKKKIIDAAKNCFGKAGLKKLTFRYIAEEAGIDPDKIRKEYKTAKNLISEVMSIGIDDVTAILKKSLVSRSKADVKLSRFIKRLLTDYEVHAPLFKLVSMNFETLDDECLALRKMVTQDQIDRYRQNTMIIARLIAEGQSEGIFRKADPLECAYYLRGLIHGAIRYWRATHCDGNLGDFADRLMRTFLTGMYK